MPLSDYIASIRNRIGTDFLLVPGVTAVIQDADRFLLARHTDSGLWGTVGGAVEPGESPDTAVVREVFEELGVEATVVGIVGAYGGPELEYIYPNGDRVGYVSVAYRCAIPTADLTLDPVELIQADWFTLSEALTLPRHPWIDRILVDAAAPVP